MRNNDNRRCGKIAGRQAIVDDELDRPRRGVGILRYVLVSHGSQHLLIVGDRIDAGQSQHARAIVGRDTSSRGACHQKLVSSVELIYQHDLQRLQRRVINVREHCIRIGDPHRAAVFDEGIRKVSTRLAAAIIDVEVDLRSVVHFRDINLHSIDIQLSAAETNVAEVISCHGERIGSDAIDVDVAGVHQRCQSGVQVCQCATDRYVAAAIRARRDNCGTG